MTEADTEADTDTETDTEADTETETETEAEAESEPEPELGYQHRDSPCGPCPRHAPAQAHVPPRGEPPSQLLTLPLVWVWFSAPLRD